MRWFPQPRWYPLVVGMCLALGLLIAPAGCHSGGSESETKTKGAKAIQPIAVTVTDLQRRTVERYVEIEGSLKAWEEVTVAAKKGGRTLRVAHDMGDRVKPGEVLVEMNPIDAELAVRQAEARYLGELAKLGITRKQADDFVSRYGAGESLLYNVDVEEVIRNLPASRQAQAARDTTRQELVRQQGLFGRGVGTTQELQKAQNEFQAAQASVDNVELTVKTNIASALASRVALDVTRQELTDMTIAAPIPQSIPEGKQNADEVVYLVSRRAVHEGQMLKVGDPVFDLVVEDPIRLWVNVPERYRPDVAIDQTVRLTAMSRPGETFTGRVARINPAVDPASRSFQVEAIVPNTEGKLRPGGFAKGQIITKSDAEAVVVPVESIYRYAGITKIFLVEDGRSLGYPVELGQELDDGVEVFAAAQSLPQTGRVVSTGQGVLARLAEGTPVAVRELDTKPVSGTPGQEAAQKSPETRVPSSEREKASGETAKQAGH